MCIRDRLISSVMANAIQEGKQGQDEAPAAEEAAPAADVYKRQW